MEKPSAETPFEQLKPLIDEQITLRLVEFHQALVERGQRSDLGGHQGIS